MLQTILELDSFFMKGDPVVATLAAFFLFVLGTIAASFSCLVAYRLKNLEEGVPIIRAISFPPSHCKNCGHRLGVVELIPVVGWIIGRGRCRSCGARVPVIYPVMEFLLGTACAALPFATGSIVAVAAPLFVLLIGFLAAIIDWENAMVPEELTWVILFAGLLASPVEPDLQYRVVGAAIGAVLGWLMTTVPGWIRGADTRAWGDVAMAAGVGAWMGCFGVAPACFAAAAIHIAISLANGDRNNDSDGRAWTPFGPALMAAFALSVTFHPVLMGLVRPDL
jgi:leader peptidase (prepilin peptidase)/N-methyltransferase